MLHARLTTLLLAAPLLMALPYPSEPPAQRSAEKITFDLSLISTEGLSQPGRQAIDYEFCIPADETHQTEVKAIDPSVQIFQHSKGRIGCRRDQLLCIGNTHQANWRSILFQLSALEYVERIDRVFWE